MGYIPMAPHVYFSQFMDDHNPNDRKRALEMNKKLLALGIWGWDYKRNEIRRLNTSRKLREKVKLDSLNSKNTISI